ncbi:hypothetical protein E2C01_065137 [Portunus trituberculatus]|uniref:Uncharacterized protein n=1 Tax=Portunus trituberculatus TaxID=210409 RepID=A0A5B7HMN3_PORTR|nr:hypothetical protein [Portunus trituberculatus]
MFTKACCSRLLRSLLPRRQCSSKSSRGQAWRDSTENDTYDEQSFTTTTITTATTTTTTAATTITATNIPKKWICGRILARN